MSVVIKNSEEVAKNHRDSFNLLVEKDFKLAEICNIRSSFVDWGKEMDDEITHDTKSNLYKSTRTHCNFCFETIAEARMFNALHDFLPNSSPEQVMTALSMIMKLYDVKSAWSFNGVKSK